MSNESLAFALSFFSLLGTPVLAPVFAYALSRQRAQRQRLAFTALAASVAAIGAAMAADISTSLYPLNASLLCFGFVALGVLAMSTFRLRPRLLGYGLGMLASILMGLSLLMGTVGALGVLFIIGDSVPLYEVAMADHRHCYVTSFGNATTSTGGYEVTFKYPWPLFPLIESASGKSRVQLENPSFGPGEACARSLGLPD